MKLIEWLKLPECKNIKDLDDPETTMLHSAIIQNKPFLKNIYIDFYNQFKGSVRGEAIMKKLLIVFIAGLTLIFCTNAFAAGALKKTVAVFDFKNDSGYRSKVNLGQDFSVQLSDALVQSGKFIVLSRKDLDVVMAEQDLARSDRFAKSNTAKTGKIIPAQVR